MGYCYLGLLTVVLLLTCVIGAPSDCRQAYHKLLQDAVTMRADCSGAGFTDCCQVKQLVPLAGSGRYEVADVCNAPASFGFSRTFAYCDQDNDGGKWLVIQRRINGSVDFYRNWTNYVYGFGDLDREFWYGLENIHCLTTREDVELRIELGNGTTPSIVWTYQLFRVQGAATNYRLTIGQGQGVGGTYDAMAYHNGMAFSTPDRDNDGSSGIHCAVNYGGGWWYNRCGLSNLNGRYGYHGSTHNRLFWYAGHRNHYTKVAMKIRPKRCSVACT